MRSLLALLPLILALAGCGKKDAGSQCHDNGDCGSLQACIDNTCRDVQCVTSADCEIHQFCTNKHMCLNGCASDSDCEAGESCDTTAHKCVAYGCRSSQLDCDYGQVCDTESGECNSAGQALCQSCDAASLGNQCGRGSCFVVGVGSSCRKDADCESGWSCDYFGAGYGSLCHQDFCMTTCNPNAADPCPRGFECTDGGDGKYYCYADCGYLTSNGYL